MQSQSKKRAIAPQQAPVEQKSKEPIPVQKLPAALVSPDIQKSVADFLDIPTLTNFFKRTCKQLQRVDSDRYLQFSKKSMIGDTRMDVSASATATNLSIVLSNRRKALRWSIPFRPAEEPTPVPFRAEDGCAIRQVAISKMGTPFVVSTSGKVYASEENKSFKEVSQASEIKRVFPTQSLETFLVDEMGGLKKYDDGKCSARSFVKGVPSSVKIKKIVNASPWAPTFAITEAEEVYFLSNVVRGVGRGQAGIGGQDTKSEQHKIQKRKISYEPRQVNHVHGITEVISLFEATFFLGKKRVWACGANTEGRLGTGYSEVDHLYPYPVLNVTDVVEIAGSKTGESIFKNYTVFREKDGGIWQCGEKNFFPSRLNLPPIKRVFSDDNAIFFMGDQGVWVMGRYDCVQLGLEEKQFYPTPQPILGFEDKEIWQITAIRLEPSYKVVYIFQGKSPDSVWMPPFLTKPSKDSAGYVIGDFIPQSIKTFSDFLPAGRVIQSYIDGNFMFFITENNGELTLSGKRIEYPSPKNSRVSTGFVSFINQKIPKDFLDPAVAVAGERSAPASESKESKESKGSRPTFKQRR